LFFDMLVAERGAGENTLSAYRNDLNDLSVHLRAAGRTIADATTDDLRGASLVGGAPGLQVSLC
jgi:integrase/recombinase XerD